MKDLFPNLKTREAIVEVVKGFKIFKDALELIQKKKDKSLPEIKMFIKSRKLLIPLIYTINLNVKVVNTRWVCIRTTNNEKIKIKNELFKFDIYRHLIEFGKTVISPYIIKSTHENVLKQMDTTKEIARIILREMDKKEMEPIVNIAKAIEDNVLVE